MSSPKNIIYPYFWKIGIGISNYTDSTVSYAFYPIPYGYNDVLIKEYTPESIPELNKLLSYSAHNQNNPIKENQKNYATKLIQKMVIGAIKNQPLLIKNTSISIEYIFSFIEAHRHLICLDNIESIELSQIEAILNVNLELLIDNALKYNVNMAQDQVINLALIPYFLQNDFKAVINDTKKDVQNNVTPQHVGYKISLIDTNPQILFQFLAYLKDNNITKIEHSQLLIKQKYFAPYDIDTQENILSDLREFYELIPSLYDATVKEFFPKLYNRIRFFNDFDVLIVIVDFSRTQYLSLPSLTYYKLKRLEHVTNIPPSVHVFHEDDGNNLFKNDTHFYGTILFNNCNYEYMMSAQCQCDFIVESTPTISYIQKLLIKKLNDYFATICGDLFSPLIF